MKEFDFPPAIAEQVQKKLAYLREVQSTTTEWVKGIMQATAAANGAEAHQEIQLCADGSGIIVFDTAETQVPEPAPQSASET